MELTGLRTVEGLREMDWRDYADHLLTWSELEWLLEVADCRWKHDGDPKKPHAALSAGGCSDTFINLGTMLRSYDGVCALLAWNVMMLIPEEIRGQITWVVGSDKSATPLARSVAHLLRAKHGKMRKTDDGGEKRQYWLQENGLIEKGDLVQQVEDLTVAGKTPQSVREGVRVGNTQLEEICFSPILAMIVDCTVPQITQIGGSRVVSLARHETNNFAPGKCPLCAVGSPRLRPRGDQGRNWEVLMGRLTP